jgi:hypothetical protein
MSARLDSVGPLSADGHFSGMAVPMPSNPMQLPVSLDINGMSPFAHQAKEAASGGSVRS